MPRKYDRTIRYYDSWFGDLTDPSKGFTAEECWQVMLAIRDCQLKGSLEPLEQLPITTRRALSMATMGEQIIRQLERAERMSARGSAGGRANQARQASPEQLAAAAMRTQLAEEQQRQREAAHEEQKRGAVTREQYLKLKKRAEAGDADARRLLGFDRR